MFSSSGTLRALGVCLIMAMGFTAPVHAQYQPEYADTALPDSASGTARAEIRIAQLEEQLRKLQGSLEQTSYQNRQLKTQLDKALEDIEFRLQALETGNKSPSAMSAVTEEDKDQLKPVTPAENAEQSREKMQDAVKQNFATPRDHYNYAFRLLNKARYAEASEAFQDFIKQYGKDPLIGNAYYWLGETHYVRKDYAKAAQSFGQGYEAMPAGPKAADNLLKLAMSLGAQKEDKKACVVLKQVVSKFGGGSTSIKTRAEQEMNRLDCN